MQGRFSFDDVPSASSTLAASHESWAASEPFPVDVPPGATAEDVVLQLRVGGTITGEVYDEEGKPDAGQAVGASGDGFGFSFGGEDSVRRSLWSL